MSLPVKFRIQNRTLVPRRLALFQRDKSAMSGALSQSHRSFVLAAKTLTPGSYWDYEIPDGSLQAAGMIQSTSGPSTSNIVDSVYGDCWEIHQKSGGPLTLEPSVSKGPADAIKIVNVVDAGLGRRMASLHRDGYPLVGFELEPGDDVCFTLQQALYIAQVEDNGYTRGKLLRPEIIASALSISYASSQSVDTHVVNLTSDAAGNLMHEVERTVREEVRPQQRFDAS